MMTSMIMKSKVVTSSHNTHTHTDLLYVSIIYRIYIFIHIHPSWDADNTRKRLGQYIYIYAINICFCFLSPRKYTKHKADVSPPRRRSPIDNLELISCTRRRLTLQRDIARSRREYLCYFVCTADFVDCIIIYAHYMWELNKLLSHFAAKWSTLRISTHHSPRLKMFADHYRFQTLRSPYSVNLI